MLVDDGLIARDNGRWHATADLGSLPVPPTIHALVAARLDRLGAPERDVLERASIEGKVFHLGAVRELADNGAASSAAADVMTLVRKELIRPDRATFGGEDAFRFRHILIRDAAYRGLPKETRAELHERFAGWLERKTGERAARVRRDRRLPPRAGVPLPRGACARRRGGNRAGGGRRRSAGCGRSQGLDPRRRLGGGQPARTCGLADPRGRSRADRADARPRRGPLHDRRPRRRAHGAERCAPRRGRSRATPGSRRTP